jgi:alkanesulfonate monooxygenase SsuD/methylene tetrahydromethanopterin reductase-like flavin-dependent oxidoreductase (luciferase family)
VRLSLWALSRQPWTELLEMARHAEATGWDGVWLPDQPGLLDTWAALGALAVAVPRVRLGSLVSNPAERHPAQLAKLASTVDQLSGGRVTLGLGAGLDSTAGADRFGRLEEACQVVRSLFDRPLTTFEGRHFRLQNAPLEPKPLQRPLPLLVGGGERLTMRTAARWADEWNAWGDADSIGRKLAVLDGHCRDAGRDPVTLGRSAQALISLDPGSAVASPHPVIEAQDIGRYAELGIDEFIVPDLLLGSGSAKLDALDTIRKRVSAAR